MRKLTEIIKAIWALLILQIIFSLELIGCLWLASLHRWPVIFAPYQSNPISVNEVVYLILVPCIALCTYLEWAILDD